MPNGGVYSAGTGLQLQNTFPGNANTGNANITGMLAAQSGFTILSPNTNETFGYGAFCSNISTSVSIGANSFVRGISFGDQGGVAIGQMASCGGYLGSQGGSGRGCIAIGRQASAGYPIVFGGDIAIGAYSQASISNIGGHDSNVCIGTSARLTNASRSIYIKAGSTPEQIDGFTDVLAIGYNMQTLVNGSSQIRIGIPTQSDVVIGPYRIGQTSGSTIKVNDSNLIMNNSQQIVMYTAITAPRTVTLPSAASVGAGYYVRLVDMSGSASATNTIQLLPSGTDTIVGAGAAGVNSAYGGDRLISDGVSKWNAINNW